MIKGKAESPSKDTIGVTPVSSAMNLKKRMGIIIAVFSFALYSQSISFNYTLDDFIVIKENSLVKHGVSAIPLLLKTDFLLGINDDMRRVPQYRPLPLVVFAIEWQLFPDNPHFCHSVNVFLYATTCWLLFILLCALFKNRTTDKPHGNRMNLFFPFVCSLLFASHPIHTEVVNSIKSLDEILCFLFSILSILLFLKAVERKSVFHFVLAAICYFASILSKETAISFLIITPLIFYVFTNIKFKNILMITLTLAACVCCFLFIRYKVLESLPMNRVDRLQLPDLNSLVAAPDLISQKATALFILLRYIILLIFPYRLTYDYSFAQIPVQHLSSPGALLGILCYLAMGLFAISKIRKKNLMAFAVLFYLLTLAPVSNVFLLIYSTMGERFLFMPSLGFCMALTFLLFKSVDLKLKARIKHIFSIPLIPFIAVMIIVVFYSLRTLSRNPDWKDDKALYSHDVKISPNSAFAHYNYGGVLLNKLYREEKNKEKKQILLGKAVAEFTKAISIFDNYPYAYAALGTTYLNIGNNAKAIFNFEMAMLLFYPKPPAYLYCDLGLAYTDNGQYEKAIGILDSSLKYNPAYYDAYLKKSYTYLSAEKYQEAVNESMNLLKYDPNNLFGYLNIGSGYLNLKQYAKAIEYLNKGLELDSTNPDCFRLLGMTYQAMGDSVSADACFRKANPTNIH